MAYKQQDAASWSPFLINTAFPCALAPWQAAAVQQFEEAAAYVILSRTQSALVVVDHRQH
jgi:hypothetical protein